MKDCGVVKKAVLWGFGDSLATSAFSPKSWVGITVDGITVDGITVDGITVEEDDTTDEDVAISSSIGGEELSLQFPSRKAGILSWKITGGARGFGNG